VQVYSYTRRGQLLSVAESGSITTTFGYNGAGQVMTEAYTGGVLGGFIVTNGYDATFRRSNLGLRDATTLKFQHNYGYDTASRLASVDDGTYSANYSYTANSPLVSQIVFKQSSTTRMTTTKSYDKLNELTSISSTVAGSSSPVSRYDYLYNDAGQRVRVAETDGSYWIYDYDKLGQVISAKKFWNDSTPVQGQQFDYGFDDIGNRTKEVKRSGQSHQLLHAQIGRSESVRHPWRARLHGRGWRGECERDSDRERNGNDAERGILRGRLDGGQWLGAAKRECKRDSGQRGIEHQHDARNPLHPAKCGAFSLRWRWEYDERRALDEHGVGRGKPLGFDGRLFGGPHGSPIQAPV
jgi:YD repeat-containing protein